MKVKNLPEIGNKNKKEKGEEPNQILVKETKKKGKKGWNIRTKATVLASLFGVLPVLLVGEYAYTRADNALTRQIAIEKIAEAEQLSDKLNRFLQERLANAETLVQLVNINTKIAESNELELNLTPEEKQAIETALSKFYRDYLVFENIALYNVEGKAIAQSAGSAPQLIQQDSAYFQQVLNIGNRVISEPITTKTSTGDISAIYLAAPVKNKQSKIVGVVAGRIPVNYLGNALLRTASLREGTTYYLIDSTNKIFQSFQDPEATPIGTNITEKLPLLAEISQEKQSESWRENSDSKATLNAYTPISSIVNLDWSLVTSTDPAIAFDTQRKLATAITLGTLITALVAALLGAIIANIATKPVQKATVVVERLGAGELDLRVPVRGNDELAILGDNINKMADEIQTLLSTQHRNTELLSIQNQTLASLARDQALVQGDAYAAAKAVTEAVVKTLGIERVSIWLYNLDRTQLTCLDLYDSRVEQHSQGQELHARNFPEYLQTLEQNNQIIAFDAQTESPTSELCSAYLIPSEIKSMLVIPIQISGQVVGIISCEKTGTTREWQPQEQSFVISVANLVSLALESEALQKEVGHLLDVVSAVEEGNLKVRASVSDRATGLVSDTLNRLIEELAEVIQQVLATAQQVSEGSVNLEQIAFTVTNGAQQQAEAVTQVLTLSEQVEASAADSAIQVQATKQSLIDLSKAIDESTAALNKLTQGIDVLQGGTDHIVQQMKTLGEFVGLADQFVQNQSEIAQQTLVLALNASLVAARASEQRDPRKFEFVAREFEKIAEQVSSLAAQTNEGLNTLEQRTAQIHEVVSAIDTEVQSLGALVGGFTQGVMLSREGFDNVKQVTEEAIARGEAVANSSEAIVTASQSTALAMRDIADLAGETAQLSQNTFSQSEEIGKLSAQLLTRIEFFQLPETQKNN